MESAVMERASNEEQLRSSSRVTYLDPNNPKHAALLADSLYTQQRLSGEAPVGPLHALPQPGLTAFNSCA